MSNRFKEKNYANIPNLQASPPLGRGDFLKIDIIPEADYYGGQDWIGFEGGLVASLGIRGQIISHTIKAPR